MKKIKLRHQFFKSELFKERANDLDAWDFVDELKIRLDSNPKLGDVIPESDGLRKIRMALPGRGKRSGARVIYFQIVDESILLIEMYAKNERDNLTHEELRLLAKVRDHMIARHKENYDAKKPT